MRIDAFRFSPDSAQRSRASWARIKVLWVVLFLLLSGSQITRAQEPTTRNELWPEVDVYIKVRPKVRLYLFGVVSKAIEDGENFNAKAFEAQIAAHVDYLPNKHVILRTGYRYGWSLDDNSYREHRLVTAQILLKMVPGKFLLSDRNQEDFRFLKGDFSFRYRNRVTIERGFRLKRRTITPYVSGEIFYDTRYDIWNRNRFGAGVQISLRAGPVRQEWPRHQLILDLFYLHQNDSRSDPPHVNGIGAVVQFHF